MHIALFVAKKVNFGIYKFVSLQYDIINYVRRYFWNCTGVVYGPYVRVSKINLYGRVDHTYRPDVRAQKMTPVRTVDTYGPYVR